MLKVKVVIPLLLFGLVLLLAGCDNNSSPPLSQAEAVKLAKSAAAQLASPPRLYYDDKGNDLSSWPDKPGILTGHWQNYSGVAMPPEDTWFPVTYTTSVITDSTGSGVDITFLLTWQSFERVELQHSWQFHVDSAREVRLIADKGETMPSAGSGNQCE